MRCGNPVPPLLFLAAASRTGINSALWLVVVQNSVFGVAYVLYHGIFKFA
jgi:hypothetical protein